MAAWTSLGRYPGTDRWMSVRFFTLPDGTPYLHYGGRATPKVA